MSIGTPSLLRTAAVFALCLAMPVEQPTAQEIASPVARRCTSVNAAAFDSLDPLRDANIVNDGLPHHNAFELGTLLIEFPDGSYGWTTPTESPPSRVSPRWEFPAYELRDGRLYLVPGGELIVGAVHTHPNSRPNSPFDRWGADRDGLPDYVLTNDGVVYLYQPASTDRFGVNVPGHLGEAVPSPPGSCRDSVAEGEGTAPGRAGAMFGEPHIVTHDGQSLAFQGAGEYLAVAGDGLSVQVRTEPFANKRTVSVVTAVAIATPSQRIGVYRDAPHVRIDGNDAREAFGNTMDADVDLRDGGLLRLNKNARALTILTAQGDRVRIQNVGGAWLDLIVSLGDARRELVSGLFGDYDGEPANDLVTRLGERVDLQGLQGDAFRQAFYDWWGESWRIKAQESAFDYAEGRTSESYQLRDFPAELIGLQTVLASADAPSAIEACRAAGIVDLDPVHRCAFDVLVTGNDAFVASHAALATTLSEWRRLAAVEQPRAPGNEPAGAPDFTANLAQESFGASASATLTGTDYIPHPKDPMSVLGEHRSWASLDRREWPAGAVPTITLTLPGDQPPLVVAVRVHHDNGDPQRLAGIDVAYSSGTDIDDFVKVGSVEIDHGARAGYLKTIIGFPQAPARRLRLTLTPTERTRRVLVYTVEVFEAIGATRVYDALVTDQGRGSRP